MTVSPEFRAFAEELFAGLGPVQSKRMFSGLGLYLDDAMFGLVIDDVIYLKTDAELAKQYEAQGSEPFSYETKSGRRTLTSHYALPEAALDDPDLALEWARKSLIPAIAAAQERRRKKAKRT